MKQAQSETARYDRSFGRRGACNGNGYPDAARRRWPADWPPGPGFAHAPQRRSWSWGSVILGLLGAVWFVIALPFRLVFWVFAWLGRLMGIVFGFLLMVVGMALWAGPFFIIGIPLFLIGLVLTLRCLE